MTKEELISKIQVLAKTAYAERSKAETSAVEYDELTKFPELKQAIIDLLTTEFGQFYVINRLGISKTNYI